MTRVEGGLGAGDDKGPGVMGTMSWVRHRELGGDEGRALNQDDKGLGTVNRWLREMRSVVM